MSILIYGQAVTPFIPLVADGLEPITYSIDPPLPGGLNFNPSNGEITGIPIELSAPTTYTISWIDVLNQTGDGTVSLTVDNLLTAISVVPDLTLTVGPTVVEFTPVIGSGGVEPFVYSISPALPPGLNLIPEIGKIAGAVSQISTLTTYTVTVTDFYNQTASESFTLTVNPIPLSAVQQTAGKTETINQVIAPFVPVLAGGGYGAITYSIDPQLPSGLNFNSVNGQITGASSQLLATQVYTVTVTDSIGQTDNQTFSLTIEPVPLTVTRLVVSRELTITRLIAPFTPVLGSNGYGQLSYAIFPTLPPGLNFNSINGQITGTPEVLSAATDYTVTVTDSANQTGSLTFSLAIDPIPLTVTRTITSRIITIDQAISPFTPVVATGGYEVITYSINPQLPTGLNFNTDTGEITGTPTVLLGSTSFDITATDSFGQSGSRAFTLTVNPVALVTSLLISNRVVTVDQPSTPFIPVSATGGYENIVYSISPALPTGLNFNAVSGQISGTPTQITIATNYTITATDDAGQTSSKTFNLTSKANAYLLTTTLEIPSKELIKNILTTPFTPVVPNGGYGALTYLIGPALPAGLNFNINTGEITGTPAQERGTQTYTITVLDQNNQVSDKSFSLSVILPEINVSVISSGAVELTEGITSAEVRPVIASGGYGTLVYSISPALPAGLNFNTTNGLITGIPSQSSSTANYTVTVTDQTTQAVSRSFSLTVSQLFLGTLFTVTEGVFVTRPIVASVTGTSYSIIGGKLPQGLIMNSEGVVSGVPGPVLTTTRNRFVVRADNSGTIVDRTYSVDTVGADEPEWSTAEGYLSVGILGENYALNNQWVDYRLSASAVEAPADTKIKYYIADGAGKLPPGLTLDENGRIFGFIRDKLTFDSNISQDGGYDTESYDGYSYDHSAGFIGTASDLTITGLPKTYQFRVTATDGVQRKERIFKIVVASTDILRYNSTSMPVGIVISTTTNYIHYPQWIKGTDLGTVRANNNQIIDVRAYDGAPLAGTITYTIINGPSVVSQLPEGLYLSTSTGYIHGFIPYQPAYTNRYSLTINATKTDNTVNQSVTITNTFTLAVKGEIESTISWISDSDLGSIEEGLTSELSVKAQQINSNYNLKYKKISGTLPDGLILETDGSISGQANYGSTGTYTFTVLSSDVYELSAIERDFRLTVKKYDDKEYTKIWARPFLHPEKRNAYREFISDNFIFDLNLIYRPLDPNFGIQSDIKMFLEFGIEKVNLSEYVAALKENFYRRRLNFGDVKVAIAADQSGNVIYEVVYVDIVDNLVNNQGKSVNAVIYSDNNIYYPGSIDNMRKQLELIVLDNNTFIGVNQDSTPRFMLTPQPGSYKPNNYVRAVPLCYALPGQGNKIVSRIKLSKFDFKLLDFELDRVIVQNSLDSSTAKYLIFERQALGDALVTDDYLIGPDDISIDDENTNPLIRE
jgi:hypothetical protein